MLCFPTLSVTPESHIDSPPEDPTPVAAKGKGKAAALPTTPPPPAPKPLVPQFADPIRAAALHALDSALSDAALERAVQQKLLMHVVEACITEQHASTSAAAVLLKRIVVMLVCPMHAHISHDITAVYCAQSCCEAYGTGTLRDLLVSIRLKQERGWFFVSDQECSDACTHACR